MFLFYFISLYNTVLVYSSFLFPTNKTGEIAPSGGYHLSFKINFLIYLTNSILGKLHNRDSLLYLPFLSVCFYFIFLHYCRLDLHVLSGIRVVRTDNLCCCCLVTKLGLILCDSIDCSLPGSSVHGISQAIILEWVAIFYSRASS